MFSGHGLKKILLFSGLILALVFSTAFVYTHINHDCFGEDCPVCIQIQGAQHLLKQLGLIGAGLFIAFLGCPVFVLPKLPLPLVCPITAIALKVRLNT